MNTASRSGKISKSMFKEVVFLFEGIFIYHAILILKAVVLLQQVTGYFNIIKEVS